MYWKKKNPETSRAADVKWSSIKTIKDNNKEWHSNDISTDEVKWKKNPVWRKMLRKRLEKNRETCIWKVWTAGQQKITISTSNWSKYHITDKIGKSWSPVSAADQTPEELMHTSSPKNQFLLFCWSHVIYLYHSIQASINNVCIHCFRCTFPWNASRIWMQQYS